MGNLLNDHGRVVRDIWLTEPAFTLSEESTPDGCFIYTMMKTHSTVEKCSLPCKRESLMSIEENFLQYRSFLTTIRKKGIQAKDLEVKEGITLMLSVVCCLCVREIDLYLRFPGHLADVVIPTHMNCGLSEGTCGMIKGILRSTGHTAISAYLRYKVNFRHPLQPTEDELQFIEQNMSDVVDALVTAFVGSPQLADQRELIGEEGYYKVCSNSGASTSLTSSRGSTMDSASAASESSVDSF